MGNTNRTEAAYETVLVDSLLAGGYEEIARDSAPSCLMGCVPTALGACPGIPIQVRP